MKKLIYDKLQRRMVSWFCLSLLFFILGTLLPAINTDRGLQDILCMFFCLFFITSCSMELNLGYGRVVLTLPFTTRQIGRVIWFISVGLPTLMFAVFSGLGIIIRASPQTSTTGLFVLWLQAVLMGGLLLGSSFWISSGTPLPQPSKLRRMAFQAYRVLFFVGLSGGGYWLYKSSCSGEVKYVIVCLAGLIFTILGWYRAEALVVEYGESRQTAVEETKSVNTFQPPSGFGGIRWLLFRSIGRQCGVLLLIFAWIICWGVFFGHRFYSADILQHMPLLVFLVMFIVMAEVTNIVLHLKYLRTLPMSSIQLAAIILVTTLIPLLGLCAISVTLTCLAQGIAAGLFMLKILALGLAPICVLATTVVWQGETRFNRIVVAVAGLIISGIAPLYQLVAGGTGLPVWFIVIYPLIFLVLTLFTISHLIRNNDMTYRIRAQDLRVA